MGRKDEYMGGEGVMRRRERRGGEREHGKRNYNDTRKKEGKGYSLFPITFLNALL